MNVDRSIKRFHWTPKNQCQDVSGSHGNENLCQASGSQLYCRSIKTEFALIRCQFSTRAMDVLKYRSVEKFRHYSMNMYTFFVFLWYFGYILEVWTFLDNFVDGTVGVGPLVLEVWPTMSRKPRFPIRLRQFVNGWIFFDKIIILIFHD